jgi:hypothetical protein
MHIETVGENSFEDVLAGADAQICAIARSLRHLVAEVMPGVTEVVWVAQKTVGYGVGPKKMSEHFCYVGLHAGHVNLGFFYGADLDDPEGMLEGSGKLLRHIKLTAPAEAARPEVRRLVTEASAHLPKLAPRGR